MNQGGKKKNGRNNFCGRSNETDDRAAVGIVVLLVLIIKFKLHPVLSMMISAIIIGAGAGMPLTMISDTVEKGVGKTLQGIALLVGLGSMFGGILEVSGGAQRIAETLIGKFGQKKSRLGTWTYRTCNWYHRIF